MKCNDCNAKDTVYRLKNGDVSDYLCSICLGTALVDLVLNNKTITFTKDEKLIEVTT